MNQLVQLLVCVFGYSKVDDLVRCVGHFLCGCCMLQVVNCGGHVGVHLGAEAIVQFSWVFLPFFLFFLPRNNVRRVGKTFIAKRQ